MFFTLLLSLCHKNIQILKTLCFWMGQSYSFKCGLKSCLDLLSFHFYFYSILRIESVFPISYILSALFMCTIIAVTQTFKKTRGDELLPPLVQ